MMLLILMGRFEVGDHLDNNMEDFLPVHKVELDAFYIDIYELLSANLKSLSVRQDTALIAGTMYRIAPLPTIISWFMLRGLMLRRTLNG